MTKVNDYNRSYENVMSFLTGEPWYLHEPVAVVLQEVIQTRINGEIFTDEEIAQRVGFKTPGNPQQALKLEQGQLEEEGPRIVNGVAILPMQGMMAPRMNLFMKFSGGTSTRTFGLWFRQAMENPNVKAVVFEIDSPGGTARGNQELVDLINQHRGSKKIVSVCEGLCASAAYYAGCCADEVVASPSSQVGSIGTAMMFSEFSEADKRRGVKVHVIRSGNNKMKPNQYEPVDEQTLKRMQQKCDSLNELFLANVAKHRQVSRETVLEKFGQGDVFLAAEAASLGIIDRVGTLEQVVNELTGNRPRGGRTSSFQGVNKMELSQIILAAMVQRELILEGCSQEVAQACLTAFFKANGLDVPKSENEILAALKQVDAVETGQSQSSGHTQQAAGAQQSAGKDGAKPIESLPPLTALEQARQQERQRIDTLMSSAELMGIPQEMLQKAIDEDHTVEAAMHNWNKFKKQTNQAVNPQVTKDSTEKWEQAATAAIAGMCGVSLSQEEQELSADLASASLMMIAEKSLKVHNVRNVPDDPEEKARMALKGSGEEIVMIDGRMSGGYNRPGDFPNLLSNVQGKMMMDIHQYSDSTYQKWAFRLNPVADFKPKTLIKTGEFSELPMIIDGEEPKENNFSEDPSFIMVDRYGTKFTITPTMIVDNDMQSWQDKFMDALIAADLTLNRLLLNLLTGNVELPDGKALFHDDHNNIVESPDVPSTAQLSAMRVLLSKQKGISNKHTIRQTLNLLLFPTDLQTDVEKLLRTDLSMVPEDTAKADIFRGRVMPVHEPMLNDYSTTYYYGFANPQRARSIVYAKQRGYTRPRVTNIYDQKTKCREFHLEDRFGGAVNDYRGVVQNPDT